MDKLDSLSLQNQVKQNSEETRKALLELRKWEQEIKSSKKKPNKEADDDKDNETVSDMPEFLRAQLSEEYKKMANAEKEMGNAAVKKNNFREALVFYTKAIEIDENDPVFYSNRAHCFLKMDRYQLFLLYK